MSKGFYRIRFKVDWDNIDPGSNEGIVGAGGIVFDTRINIHEDSISLSKGTNADAVYGKLLYQGVEIGQV